MKQRRYSGLQMLLAALAGGMLALASGILALWLVLGPHALSLLSAWGLVRAEFVGDYDSDTAIDSALDGMVKGLGDRWSYYLTAEGYASTTQRRNNAYVGIGVTVDYVDERGLRIVEVREGTPAGEAGLLPGEIITAVDGASVAGEAQETGADRIQGEAGTDVTLTLLNENEESRQVTLTRQQVQTPSVSEAQLLEGDVGYIKLDNFYSGSARELCDAVDSLMDEGACGFVFDMRNNGGGYVSELTEMLDHLLPEGPIFRSQTKSGKEEVTYSDESCVDLPFAVLVNGDTYSAAEFFAAQLQESVGAAVVGEYTSGKGYSQQTILLPHGGALNISTGKYTTGAGVSLVGTGLNLDAEVSLTEEQRSDFLLGALDLSEDPQFQKALEYLK
ncbi:MAG: PDZ domain-containing protein [Oscillospiraceae bacterium]|nr:PDZ domain-containing protein [Oscillospiraceae bacterium]